MTDINLIFIIDYSSAGVRVIKAEIIHLISSW